MWNQLIPQRALLPFAFLGILTVTLPLPIASLRTPFAVGLLVITVLLLLLLPIESEIRSSSRFRTRVLIVGNDRTLLDKFVQLVEENPKRGYSIVGLVEESTSSKPRLSPYFVLGAIDDLYTIVQSVRPHRIFLALSDRRGRLPATQLLEFQLKGIAVEDVVDAYERFSGKLAIEAVTPGQLIASQRFQKSRALLAVQRAVSFSAAAILMLVSAPLFALIAMAIKLDSGGPVLFRQTRLGKGCRPFQLIKFRTMQPVESPASEWVQDNLARITRLGRWLRELRLDELPQLVNILRGDMNLVGPRPHPVSNLQLFREAIPYYLLRASVLPGITGWAQTRYRYANNLEQETEKMRYDLYYIKHMSLWMDVRIIVDTFRLFIGKFSSIEGEKLPATQPVTRPHALLRVKEPVNEPHMSYVNHREDSSVIHAE